MFNLTYILDYLPMFNLSAHGPSPGCSDAVRKDPSSKYIMLCLITITAMVVFHISDYRELRKQERRQDDRLAAVENGMVDIRGRLLPNGGYPLLDKDDDFMLPPPAYELHGGL